LSTVLIPFLQPSALSSLPLYTWISTPSDGKHRLLTNPCKDQIPAIIEAFYGLAWRTWCHLSEPQDPDLHFAAAEAAFNAVRSSACTPAVLRSVLTQVNVREAWDEICKSADMIRGPWTEAEVGTGLVFVEEWLLHCAMDPRALFVYNQERDPGLRDWGVVERQVGVLGRLVNGLPEKSP
jgi:hypothetical protein